VKSLGALFENVTFLIVTSAVSGAALLLSFTGALSGILPFDSAWVSILLSGLPILYGALKGLILRFDIKADVLVSIALSASVIIGEYFAAGEIAFIMMVGKLLEDFTASKAREGLGRLIRLSPRNARVLRGGEEFVIPCEEVGVGEIVRVLPGETVAVDGIITEGRSSVDQSIMTGESLPVDKSPGSEVFGGTVNQYGAVDIRVTKAGEDSSIQRMIRLVREADARKAPIVRITDRWAAWIVIIALSSAGAALLVTGEIIRAVTILVVFCPCALVLATPTAIMAAIGNASKYGILIRSGDALERMAKSTVIAFDKTGTLTHGKPEVIAVKSLSGSFSEENILLYAASAELRSEHPLGRAIVNYAKSRNIPLKEPSDFSAIPGMGISVTAAGRRVRAGSRAFIEEETGPVPQAAGPSEYTEQGATVVYLAVDGLAAGLIALSDTLRDSAPRIMEAIENRGMKTILLTGDNRQAALHIAKELGISSVKYELLPEHKAAEIEKLQAGPGEKVCMVGDGINDAPALKTAYTGVAVGGAGSDIAVDAAGIVLVSDDIERIPH
jgi:heavy metal translocating P-type ATPase